MAERVFLLPDPGEGLTEAEVVEWLVAEGEDVELNQPIVEVETAKAAVEIPSPYAGRIMRLHVPEGELAHVGNPLVTFEVEGVEERAPAGAEAMVRATPAVRRLARDLDVDLAAVAGSAPEGRITADDVRAASGSWAATVQEDLRTQRRPVSATRRAIAETLERQAAIPQVTTFRTVDCTALEAFRRELGVSPLPVVIASLVPVIEDHPLLNATWRGADPPAIDVHGKINVGIATDTERGLLVPVVRDAGGRGIVELAEEVRRLAGLARDGKLGPHELAGATIALSNTGSYGSEAGTPILSPGTAVTLALGAIAPRAVVAGGSVEVRPACTLSVTFDHRVLDGAAVGGAITDLVGLVQDQDRLGNLPR
jgi:pyruvate dehydrogenase E2 component (dihydrolipoamide acetyltransferase)